VALDKKHKAFRFQKVMPIDANNVIFEQAFARLLVLVRTKGLPITSTTKSTLHPEDLVEIIVQDKEHFQGIKDNPQRKRLLEHWIASDFTTCVKEGRGHSGEARIASMKPIHMSTIKLLDPRIRSQDRDASVFLYNIFRDSGLIIGDHESFRRGVDSPGNEQLCGQVRESIAKLAEARFFRKRVGDCTANTYGIRVQWHRSGCRDYRLGASRGEVGQGSNRR
jgi:hypothetical protein